jgi:hypothetical protein
MYTALNSPDRAMDQQSTTISKFAGVGADLIYPLADAVSLLNGYDSARDVRAVLSPHGAFEDPTGTADVLGRECTELRTIAFHSAAACAD